MREGGASDVAAETRSRPHVCARPSTDHVDFRLFAPNDDKNTTLDPPGVPSTMPLLRMEHYLVLSDDIDKTKDFYCDALGMREGFRPKLDFPGYWLYFGDTPCIHIAEWQTYAAWTQAKSASRSRRKPTAPAPSTILRSTRAFQRDAGATRRHGFKLSENLLDDIGLRQLFLYDPNGVAIELNFRD